MKSALRLAIVLCSVISMSGLSLFLAAQDKPQIAGLDSLALTDTILFVDTIQPELRIGIFSGGNISSARVSKVPVMPQSRAGFHMGLRTEMEFAWPVYLLFEAEYSQRGINSSYETLGGLRVSEIFKFGYLNFPIVFQFGIPINNRFDFSAGFGAVPSALISRTRSIRFNDADTSFNIEKGLEGFDFGLEYRVGLEYRLSPRHSLTLNGRYLHGLQNILILPTTDDDRDWKNTNFSLSVGVMYQLQHSVR